MKFKVGDKVKFSENTGYSFWNIETAFGVIQKIISRNDQITLYEVKVTDISFNENRTYPFCADDIDLF